MRLALLLLLVLPPTALAQARLDMDGADPIALLLIGGVCAGLAWFGVRRSFACSHRRGMVALSACILLGFAGLAYPPARALLAGVTAIFLVYGFFATP